MNNDLGSDGEDETESGNEEEEDNQERCQTEEEDGQNKRKDKRKITRPKYLEDYTVLALHAESFIEDVPECFEDISSRPDQKQWMEAVNEEMQALKENDTWILVHPPPGRKILENKWIFRVKRNEEGEVDRYKARLVVKGCAQKKGFDYTETYAPVARLTTVRTLLSVINKENLYAQQMDVKNAFLHGNIKEELYMKQLQSLNENPKLVYKLNTTLYRLKQAPREWNFPLIVL
jgi:hypothetical protein